MWGFGKQSYIELRCEVLEERLKNMDEKVIQYRSIVASYADQVTALEKRLKKLEWRKRWLY